MVKMSKTLVPGGRVEGRFTNIEGKKIVKTAGIPQITRSRTALAKRQSTKTTTMPKFLKDTP